MAVEGFLLKKIDFPVAKPSPVSATTLDHVRRILNDHDYARNTVLEGQKGCDVSILKAKCSIDLLDGNCQVLDGVCNYPKPKFEFEEQLPKDGIAASDVSSLLEQFLEYEQDSNQSANVLTPATSPGRCETWNEMSLGIKMDSHKSTTLLELTPPSTPPVLEPLDQQKMIHDSVCSIPLEQCLKRKDGKIAESTTNVKTTHQRKRKLQSTEASCASETKKSKLPSEFKKCTTLDRNKNSSDVSDTKSSKENDCSGELCEHGKKGDVLSKGEIDGNLKPEKSQNDKIDQILPCVVTNKCKKYEEKSLSEGEVSSDKKSGKRNSESEICQKNSTETETHDFERLKPRRRKAEYDDHENARSKRCGSEAKRLERKRSRLRSTDDEDSGDDRYDSRTFEQSHCSRQEVSKRPHERERRSDYHRRRSEYDHNSNRSYHDDKREHYRRRSNDKKCCDKVRDIEQERKIDFRLGRSTIKDIAKEERRVVYVGGLPYGTTQDELWKRLRRFGPVENVTVHLREGERDNYGFVTFFEPEDARQCIEKGNSDRNEPKLDLCFGGRRQYCGGSYVDFDSKTSRIEELNETFGNVCGSVPEEEDFDSLLRKCQDELRSGN